MNGIESNALLSSLSRLVADKLGLYFPQERWCDLKRGVESACRELGFKDVGSCVRWLLSSPPSKGSVQILASHLTVGETCFFRDERCFRILEEQILPELIGKRRQADKRLRIWSAGCSTGEEPYSIAISLRRTIPDLKDWEITILATDVNSRSLEKASNGVYSEWSFREAPPWVKDGCFKSKGEGRFEILPDIKRMVTFSYLNLVEDVYPSLLNNTNAMDVIFCRNVLMYLTEERARRAVQNFYRSLVDGGYLIVSPIEASHVLSPQFEAAERCGIGFYRKAPSKAQGLSLDLEACGLMPLASDHRPRPETSNSRPENLSPEAAILREEAKALYGQGRYADAVDKLRALLSRDAEDAEAMALLARAYANEGKLDEALKWCQKAIAADKLNAGFHHLKAIILQEQGAIDEAIISLRRALYLDQNFVLAHFSLGNLALVRGSFKEANKHFQNVLSLLEAYGSEDMLPESEGITAGRLMEIVRSTSYKVKSS